MDSLIMEDKHLDTIPETESDELIKSSVEDLVQIPLSRRFFRIFRKDVPNENFKIFSNPLFDLDEEITSIKIFASFEYFVNDSQKIDSLLDEFTGELTLPHSIPPGIDDVNLDPEENFVFWRQFAFNE
ncbi:hypothetical protein Tco_1042410 [Tanacetum coccineum]|uniref:Uncharacterized protein n=1 Tax=Tanacetum coccineum TaxID=301880 RepID=A0ABQ5GJK0_9ASTR